jgi:hypothetical protein
VRISVIGLLFVGLCGCQSHTITVVIDNYPGQWVLVSYDSEKGYVFAKDQVQYEAHCAGFISGDAIRTLPPGFVLDPGPRTHESACSAVLPYLHKPAPIKQDKPFSANELALPIASDGSFKDGAWQFVITEAK